MENAELEVLVPVFDSPVAHPHCMPTVCSTEELMNYPNLLVIMSDEHQARAMSCATECARRPVAKTPVLDKLARQGTRFTRAYTPSPICVPARASFATGQYVHQIRHWDNAMPYAGATPGWGHVLQDKEISVESVGKLHYRDAEDPVGFDTEHLPMMVDGQGMVWGSIRNAEDRVIKQPGDARMLGDYIGPGTSRYTEYDASVVKRTQQWLRERAVQAGEPWCLYVGLVAPHFPLVAPQDFYDLYEGKISGDVKQHPHEGYPRHPWVELHAAHNDNESWFEDRDERLRAITAYYGLCSWMDYNVGQITSALEEHGFADNTTVIYTSDHGDNVGARGLWGKSNMYEESVSVPLIISGPNVAAGRVSNTPVSLLDISATITSHFGESLSDAVGDSLYGIAAKPDDNNRVVFSEYHAVGSVSGVFMVVKGQYKLIHYQDFEPEFFDLKNDPEELTNVADNPEYAIAFDDLNAELLNICDTAAVDRLAHQDQHILIESVGGLAAAKKIGPKGATPPPI